ncbi:MAG: 60S ribosomal protein L22 [Candidatus Bathyarchaeota archaeon]|jgi:hypothetical protein
MTETLVDVSDLKKEGKELIDEMVEFLEKKTEVDVEATPNGILVKLKEGEVSRRYLKVLLKKFLHKQELRNLFRVIGGREDSLIINERKIYSEE